MPTFKSLIESFQFNQTDEPPKNESGPSILSELFIGVVSKTDNFERRVVIRATWGRYAIEHGARLLFIVARSRLPQVNQQVQEEQARYGDMLQMQFDEDYYNLTLKSVALLEYAATHCSQVKHVLKIDDDVLPNWPMLEQQFNLIRPINTSSYVICTAHNFSQPQRDPTNKWYVPLEIFQGKLFPTYCSGPAYLLSMPATRLLLAHLRTSSKKIFYLEDVYVTGMLREHEPRVLMVNEPNFLNNNPLIHHCDSRDQLFHHHMNSKTMLLYWPWTLTAKCYRPWYYFALRWF